MQFSAPVKSHINLQITPLIDLMFIIVIFLLVSTTFVEQPAVKINLPRGRVSEKIDKQPFIITVDTHQNIYLNDAILDKKQLFSRLNDTHKETPQTTISLRADRTVNYGLAIEIIDLIKQAGFDKIVIQTQSE